MGSRTLGFRSWGVKVRRVGTLYVLGFAASRLKGGTYSSKP